MTLRDEILTEHSKNNVLRISRIIGNNKVLIKELINLTLGEDKDIARKAAWILRYNQSDYPAEYIPYISKMIDHLRQNDIHVAVKRNFLAILRISDIPRKNEGDLLDICFNFILSGKETVAVKAFSIDIIYRIGKREPSIMNELRLILEDQLPYGSAGIKSKAKKIISGRNKYFDHDL